MAQLTPMGLVKILVQVTAIMVIPIMGGVVVGLILDRNLETSPLLALSGLAGGTLIAAIGIWLLIRAGVRRGYTQGKRGDGP
jgi:F0F1-type ATP synthase assembly protein I